jgi:hypothetical protein
MHETAMMSDYLEVLAEDRFNIEVNERPLLHLIERKLERSSGIAASSWVDMIDRNCMRRRNGLETSRRTVS